MSDPVRARELARPLAPAARGSTTVDEALEALEGSGPDRLPVLERGGVGGTLDAGILGRARCHGLGRLPIRDLLLGEVRTVPANVDLERVRRELLRPGRPLVLVRAPSGRLGYIRLADLPGAPDPVGPVSADLTAALEDRLSCETLAALRRLGAEGLPAYLVGGPVRDLSLDRPTRDLDVVIEGDVLQAARRLGKDVRYHEAFQTASVTLEDGTRIDLARAREEHYPRPASLPRVEPSDLERDLGRRDFTVNTLALSLDPSGFGRVIDPLGGLDDLRRRRLRVLHGLSFIDDPTRAFRAARLAARLGFEVGPRTSHLIRVALRLGVFDRLSAARLRGELERALDGTALAATVRELRRHTLFRALDGELRPPPALARRLERLEGLFDWYGSLPGKRPLDRPVAVLGLLLQRAEGRRIEHWLDRLQPGRAGRRILRQAARGLDRLVRTLSERRRTPPSRIYLACRDWPAELLLVAVALGGASIRRRIILYLAELDCARPDITGRDLLRAGVRAGPDVARGLEAALLAKLDGRGRSAAEQLSLALRKLGRP